MVSFCPYKGEICCLGPLILIPSRTDRTNRGIPIFLGPFGPLLAVLLSLSEERAVVPHGATMPEIEVWHPLGEQSPVPTRLVTEVSETV
jgi:hypothetical protein